MNRDLQEHGYFIKRKLVSERLLEKARSEFWAVAPARFSREDPTTWTPFTESEKVSDVFLKGSLTRRSGNVWREFMRGENATSLHEIIDIDAIQSIVHELIGEYEVLIRGIFCILPSEDNDLNLERSAHIDKHAFDLGAVIYLEDCPPGNGGLTIWPGAHKNFEGIDIPFDLQTIKEQEQRLNWNHRIEVSGQAGDVIFWHPLIPHVYGVNILNRMRQAIFCDFKKI